jgi:protein Mpv17
MLVTSRPSLRVWLPTAPLRLPYKPNPSPCRATRRLNHRASPSLRSHKPSSPRANDSLPPHTPPPNPTKSESASKTIPGPAYFWIDSLSAPLRFYSRAQENRPYLTQLISTLTVYLLGDISAQKLSGADPEEPYSFVRTLRALLIGGLAAIPGYKWFMWLGRSFNYSSKTLSIAVKVVVNQLAFTPLFNTYFFGMQSALTGASLAEIAERIKNTVPTSWINSLKVWPAVIAFNFAFIPMHFRSIFAGQSISPCFVLIY